MKLFIVRHGEAAFDARSDRLRPLTDYGRKQCENQVGRQREQLSECSEIWVSELLRAGQTAEIFSQTLGIPVREKRFLSPDTDPKRVMRELESAKGIASLVLVSHQPLVGSLVSLLCAGNVYEAHPFATAEIVALETEIIAPGTAEFLANWLSD